MNWPVDTDWFSQTVNFLLFQVFRSGVRNNVTLICFREMFNIFIDFENNFDQNLLWEIVINYL